MNGVHDLGGTDGLGPVLVEEDEPVWHAEWEKAAFGMFPFNFAAGFFGCSTISIARAAVCVTEMRSPAASGSMLMSCETLSGTTLPLGPRTAM